MLIRGVVRNEIHEDTDTAGMGRLHHGKEILFWTEVVSQLKVIGHRIPVVDGGIYRREPEGVDAQVSQVIQLILDRSGSRGSKESWDDPVDNRFFHPGWIFMIIVRDARLAILHDNIYDAGILAPGLIDHAQGKIIFAIDRRQFYLYPFPTELPLEFLLLLICSGLHLNNCRIIRTRRPDILPK